MIAKYIKYWLDEELHECAGFDISSHVDDILMLQRAGRAIVMSVKPNDYI